MRVLAFTAVALGLIAPAASATVRYVSTTGVGSGTCDAAHPCTIAYGFGAGSVSGDSIAIASGTYDVTAAPLDITKQLLISGPSGGARPVIKITSNSGTAMKFDSGSAGSTLTHVAFLATAVNGLPLWSTVAVTLSDLDVTGGAVGCVNLGAPGATLTTSTLTMSLAGTSPCLSALQNNTTLSGLTVVDNNAPSGGAAANVGGTGTTVQDSTFSTTQSGTIGLELSAGAVARRVTASSGSFGIYLVGSVTLTDSVGIGGDKAGVEAAGSASPPEIRNVTAIGTGAGSAGLRSGQGIFGAAGATMHVRNSIARGVADDLLAEDGSTCPVGLNPCTAASMTIDHSNFRTKAGAIADNGSEQSGDPLFANAAAFDFHLGAGSPAIDAGIADATDGPTDRDGNARAQGAAPDLGAFETTPVAAPPSSGGDAGSGGATSGGAPGSGGTTGGGGSGATADTTAPVLTRVSLTHAHFRLATTLRFTLSEAATVTASASRAGKPSKVLVKEILKAKAGRNTLRFAARVHGKGLRPGRYRLTIRARDAAGNVSKAVRLAFWVLPA